LRRGSRLRIGADDDAGRHRKDENAPESRALVLARAASTERRPTAPRSLASFTTQLFACEAKLEGFRRHRRAKPERASASYEASGQIEDASRRPFERLL